MWKQGDRLTHRHNPDLGPGRVAGVEGRTIVVDFPESGTSLRLSADSDALAPIEFDTGSRARLGQNGPRVRVAAVADDGTCTLDDGRTVPADELWPDAGPPGPAERLARGDVDPVEDFVLRLDALHLRQRREARGLGTFLGGRIEIFPHQLHAAERATATDPVRWLLADEVGLGKTVEACLVAAHLLRTGRAGRTLVVAPETLTVQWLGELWRKFHQVFVLLDDKRLADVERELGKGFNPFEAHEQMVIALERLAGDRALAERAAAAGIDLLVVDEAHHLRRPLGHPGNAAWRAVEPIARRGRHVLLLTATPLEEDAHGFLRLVQLLRPEAIPDDGTPLERRLESGDPLPPCTSATRREDLGGLPPRLPAPAEIDPPAWDAVRKLEAALRAEPAGDPLARRRKAERLERLLASGLALDAVLHPDDAKTRRAATRAASADPRLDWLAAHGRRWHAAGEKTLVFVAHRETLELLRQQLRRRAQLPTGVFHEELSPAQRDIEVAQFRLPTGPPLLVATECGGEGRNFQFCHRIVLYDLPWNPVTVEQRIGRLDRIGRRIPVEIVYFRPPDGVGALVAEVYERIGIFEKPIGGLDRELADVRVAIETLATDPDRPARLVEIEDALARTLDAERRVEAAAWRELHQDRYRASMADAILARVPDDLDELNEDVVLAACERLRLKTDAIRDGAFWAIELGTDTEVESLPGVSGGTGFVGTFRRDLAVEHESDDFFAAGHPLVEGLLAHVDESPLGRVALLHVSAGDTPPGLGLAALYADGPRFAVVCVDMVGRPRPEWGERLKARPLRTKRVKVESWTGQPRFEGAVRRLAAFLDVDAEPVAVALLRVG